MEDRRKRIPSYQMTKLMSTLEERLLSSTFDLARNILGEFVANTTDGDLGENEGQVSEAQVIEQVDCLIAEVSDEGVTAHEAAVEAVMMTIDNRPLDGKFSAGCAMAVAFGMLEMAGVK